MTKKTKTPQLLSAKTPSLPFVSICTPTFNRRPFIPIMFECFRNQTYPKSRIEWIIIDDGTDKIGDLVDAANIPQINYFTMDKKMTLGAKRNMMHEKSRGSIIVYMDDDDYYPPERVSHAVETLMKNPHALCAGASEIYLYFKNTDVKNPLMYQFGPYNQNHATAATFAFRRELLNITRYESHACLAEEKAFLKDYTIPFVQLDPLKTILVFSHEHNSFDKRTLLENPNPNTTKISNKTVDMFIKHPHEDKIKNFFLQDIDELLRNYAPGEPRMKSDVLKQMKEMKEQRTKQALEQQKQQPPQIMMQQPGKDPVPIGMNDAVNIINQQQNQLKEMLKKIQDLETTISSQKIVSFSDNKPNDYFEKKIQDLENKITEKTVIEEKLYSQVKILLLKNSELISEISSIKTNEHKEGTSISSVNNNTRDQSSVQPENSSHLPFTVKLKSDPEFKIKI
jgi:glycosyltransferase involved in cell wall biosynthesis